MSSNRQVLSVLPYFPSFKDMMKGKEKGERKLDILHGRIKKVLCAGGNFLQ
jgi:hypothetical protein